MYVRALRGYEKAWGPNHTSTLTTVASLGALHVAQGKEVEVKHMYERALQGNEKGWGPDHTSTLDAVSNPRKFYADHGKMEEAEQMYVRIMQTVLHVAAQTGELSIVQFTLDHGADAKVADTTGRTALHSAAAEGHESIVKLLLDNGADMSATDEDGDTALLAAALRGNNQRSSCCSQKTPTSSSQARLESIQLSHDVWADGHWVGNVLIRACGGRW
jgi:hypothetical protein